MLPIDSQQQQSREEAHNGARTGQAKQRHPPNASLPLQWNVLRNGMGWIFGLRAKAFARPYLLQRYCNPGWVASVHYWQPRVWTHKSKCFVLHSIGDDWINRSRFGVWSSRKPEGEETLHLLRRRFVTTGYAKVANSGSVPMTQSNQHASGAKHLVLRRISK